MDGFSERPRQTKAIMEEARALLSALTHEAKPEDPNANVLRGRENFVGQRADPFNQNARITGDTLARCVTLLEDFTQLSSADPMVDGQSWTVLKAVMEVLVRFGICPYLSDGVGIPLEKRFGGNAASAVAAAVSDHLVHEEPSGLPDSDTSAGARETPHLMVHSTEFLSSLVLKDAPMSSSAGASFGSAGRHHCQPNLQDGRGDKQGKASGVGKSEDGEEGDSGFSSPTTSLRQLVLSHYLVDVLAGVLQIAYGPLLKGMTGRSLGLWSREDAAERRKALAERLPVEYVVEALFILLGNAREKGPGPPPWLKSEVGKLLSLVVMRDGGVGAVLERLVGKVEKGNMHVFVKVATQLARVPRSVTTREEYYREVCKQLHPLLILRHSQSTSASSSEVAAQVLDNMQLTAMLLACKMGLHDPDLVEIYLTRPIAEPLLRWGDLQPQSVRDQSIGVTAENINPGGLEGEPITEDLLLNSFLKVQVLVTAGHEGSRCLQQQLLNLTAPLTFSLLILSYLLWPVYTKLVGSSQEPKVMDGPSSTANVHRGGSCEEWKDGGPGHGSGDDPPSKLKGFVASTANAKMGELADALFDFTPAHLADRSRQLAPIVYEFLLNAGTVSTTWPTHGDIADILALERRQPNFAAVFVSKLLLWSENWELVLVLVGVILENVLRLRCARTHDEGVLSGNTKQEPSSQLVEDLEIIIVEVGLHAAQRDTRRSIAILMGLLHDERLLKDEEILVKVLTLLRSPLNQLQNERNSNNGKAVDSDQKVRADMLIDLSNSLRRLQSSRGEITMLNECVAQLRFLTTAL